MWRRTDLHLQGFQTAEGSGSETVISVAEGSGARRVVVAVTERATRTKTGIPTRNHVMVPNVTPMRATSDSQVAQTLTTRSQRRVQGVTWTQAQGAHTWFLSLRQEAITEQQQGEQSAAPSNPRFQNSGNTNAMEDRARVRQCLEDRNQFAALGDSNEELEDDLFSDHQIDEMLRTNTMQTRATSVVDAEATSSESSAQQRSTKSKTRAQSRATEEVTSSVTKKRGKDKNRSKGKKKKSPNTWK
ncbi:hypothetical protein IFM89_031970 [Coptis chinensis]|uniref:Uncharacterized protein n=1 Tax=Coptis chinensis TaxID=261450 RepID=A0A835HE75_9MAGN|nr:hypothetical protein IFM89_031970 [Coptis chinensis]